MRYIFKFPDIGEGLEEGIIVEWHVEKGQKVKMGDSLVTMETDKVVTGIPSPKDGIIAAKFGKVGETIHVGSALVEIDIEGVEGEAAIAEATGGIDEKKIIAAVEEEGAGVVGTLEVAGNSMVLSASREGLTDSENENKKPVKVLATPVARAVAKDLGVDINKVTGTGPGGRVVKEDIVKFTQEKGNYHQSDIQSLSNTQQKSESNRVEIEPLTQIRKTIAKNMINSKHKDRKSVV